jgi:hypothetical protein
LGTVFSASVEALVETIFDHEGIKTQIDTIEEVQRKVEVAEFIRHQKGSLARHLEETIEGAIINVLADLERIKATATPDVPHDRPTFCPRVQV